MLFKRSSLGYDFSALNPFIDTATMEEHYNVHYKKYTDNFNTALIVNEITTDGSYDSLKDILAAYQNYDAIRNNGGGYLNHMFYFENISPMNRDYNTYASDELKVMIDAIGGHEELVRLFSESGLKVFGSGWVWLIEKMGRVMIVTTKNQDNPIMSTECRILLGMDVWEHAYYLKHKADRAAYIRDFLETIDWSVVSSEIIEKYFREK
jgi:Fe-Mn family superoxide dismutase